MLFDDTFNTIADASTGAFNDRGSKFLAFAYPIDSDAAIKDMVLQLKQQHPKANHYCWAMRLTPDRSIFRLNDDGEPSGTAGRPILNTLLSNELTNILIVVVRYFGGTLLGVPGLINAYRTAAESAIKQSTIIQKTSNDVYAIYFDYLQMNAVMKTVKDESLIVVNQALDNECSMQICIRKTNVNQTVARFEKMPGVRIQYLRSE